MVWTMMHKMELIVVKIPYFGVWVIKVDFWPCTLSHKGILNREKGKSVWQGSQQERILNIVIKCAGK